MCIAAAYIGMHAPLMFLKNRIARRQLSIKRAFPDTLDLLLICVESGMSIEAAFRKVSEEVGTQSVALAEELTLTTAELSYLPDRRQAYENLAKRTDLEGVKSVCMALQQAERYGTPLANMLRVMAQENRDMRMSEAEKKAAGLPPKLTVPMILFFLPVLFIVILGPGRDQGHGDPLIARRGGQIIKPAELGFSGQVPASGGGHVRLPGFLRPVFPLRQHLPRYRTLAAASSAGRSALAIFSASAKRPSRPTTSARFCRTFGAASGRPIACCSVASARRKSLVSA